MTISPFCEQDLEAVVAIWNRTARGRTLYYPLTPDKLRRLFLEKPDFDPAGFLLAQDARGIAGGVMVSAPAASSDKRLATLYGLFDRAGHPGRYAQAALDAALAYLEARGATGVSTHQLATVDSRDLSLLDFLWLNRFHHPGVYDGVIEQQVSLNTLYLSCELTAFHLPPEIVALEETLAAAGYTVRLVRDDAVLIPAFAASDVPFGKEFAAILRTRSPLEYLFVACLGDEPVGGALASCPGAPTDWSNHGCSCGLFGPTGVSRKHRGGVGKVLLFRTLDCLRQLGYREAMIPIAPSILPFYRKAGARVARVALHLQRPLGALTLNVR